MLIVISPAKKLDYTSTLPFETHTEPQFLSESQTLIDELRHYSVLDLMELMKLSQKLAELNFSRYEQWRTPFDFKHSRQALLAFKGDVYAGLNTDTFSPADFDFAQQHLRILSGLYGTLRPLDLMLPYRLEMGSALKTERGKNLYEFWGDTITQSLNDTLATQGDRTLINLASKEYFKSVRPQRLNGTIITPIFKEKKDTQYKVIGIYAKKARGLLSAYIIRNRLSEANDLKTFEEADYTYQKTLSDKTNWVFTRG